MTLDPATHKRRRRLPNATGGRLRSEFVPRPDLRDAVAASHAPSKCVGPAVGGNRVPGCDGGRSVRGQNPQRRPLTDRRDRARPGRQSDHRGGPAPIADRPGGRRGRRRAPQSRTGLRVVQGDAATVDRGDRAARARRQASAPHRPRQRYHRGLPGRARPAHRGGAERRPARLLRRGRRRRAGAPRRGRAGAVATGPRRGQRPGHERRRATVRSDAGDLASRSARRRSWPPAVLRRHAPS